MGCIVYLIGEQYKSIELSQGKVALVSIEDYDRVRPWSWHFDGRYARGYPHGVKEYLHRFIMKPKQGEVVDHINGERLDCRRSNLRCCSASLNAVNQHTKVRNKYGFKGVYWSPAAKRFRAEIYHMGRHYSLGSYLTSTEAGVAYANARAAILGGTFVEQMGNKVGNR